MSKETERKTVTLEEAFALTVTFLKESQKQCEELKAEKDRYCDLYCVALQKEEENEFMRAFIDENHLSAQYENYSQERSRRE